MPNRHEFAEEVCATKLLRGAVVTPEFNPQQANRLPDELDVVLQIGNTHDDAGLAEACARAGVPVLYTPGISTLDAGPLPANVQLLNRCEIDIGVARIGGAPLAMPESTADGVGERILATRPADFAERMRMHTAAFREDARWLSARADRVTDDDQIYLAVTASMSGPDMRVDIRGDFRERLRAVGDYVRLDRASVNQPATGRLRAIERTSREEVSGYASILVGPGGITCPRLPVWSATLRTRSQLGACLHIVDRPQPGLTTFSLGAPLYTTDRRRTSMNASEQPIYLRQKVLDWLRLTSLAVRRMGALGVRHAIEAFPVGAIGSDRRMAAGILVESIDDATANELRRMLDAEFGWAGRVHADVIPVRSLNEAKELVRTLSASGLDAIHDALSNEDRIREDERAWRLAGDAPGHEAGWDEELTRHSVLFEKMARASGKSASGAHLVNRYQLAPYSSNPEAGLIDARA